MQFDTNSISDFKVHSKEVLDKINNIQSKDTLGKSGKRFGKRSSVMYLVTKKRDTDDYVISVGHISKAGSFIPTYNNIPEIRKYVLDNTIELFKEFHSNYIAQNPTKQVLYIRHNIRNNVIEMFSSGNCVLTSKVFSHP